MATEINALTTVAPAFESYIWQGAIYNVLINDFAQHNAVHAYLIVGENGLGKRTLARLCGQALLCTGGLKPCGECDVCIRYQKGAHPDVITVVREEKKASIGVEAIRELITLISRHTYESGKRIVIIDEADKLTFQAQNSLLKSLEEPQDDIVFFLISRNTDSLLPTVLSRCRTIKLRPWDDQYIRRILEQEKCEKGQVESILKICDGNIGRAIDLLNNDAIWEMRKEMLTNFFMVSQLSDILSKSNLIKEDKNNAFLLLDTIEQMVRELLLVNTGMWTSERIDDYPAKWQDVAINGTTELFAGLFEVISRAKVLKSNQVNWQAVYETLLLGIMEELTKWQK